jgi:Spy/CpxP family protein refolding chaperone
MSLAALDFGRSGAMGSERQYARNVCARETVARESKIRARRRVACGIAVVGLVVTFWGVPTSAFQSSARRAADDEKSRDEVPKPAADAKDKDANRPDTPAVAKTLSPKEEEAARLAKRRRLRLMAQGGDVQSGALKPSKGGGIINLLKTSEAFQKELKLTDDQKQRLDKVTELLLERKEEMKRQIEARKDEMRASGVPYDPSIKREAYMAYYQEAEAALASVLTQRQLKRIEQIRLQIIGPAALAEEGVARQVMLTTEQWEQVIAVVAERDSTTSKLESTAQQRFVNQPIGDATARRNQPPQTFLDEKERAEKLADQQIANILQPRQRRAFNALLGPEFDVLKLLDEPPPPTDGPATKKKSKAQSENAPE